MIARFAPLAALLLAGCAYDYPGGYAPQYPAGYDSGMGSGQYAQPDDQFGGQNVASIEVFYQALAPYGRWIDSRYGYAFQPQTNEGWRPYVNGRWGENRLWISDDPWGWATDHYGRWGYDDRIGWVWVPGTQWAPSWVAFREADQVTGWAPIPPGVSYSVGVGFGTGFGYDNFNSWYQPSWVWVPRSYLYRPGFGGSVLPWNNGASYWRGSRWNYNHGYNNRPNYGRPGTARPPVYRPQPGQGGRPVYGRPRDGVPPNFNGVPPNVDGRPYRGEWQGERPRNGQPGQGYGGGRPNRAQADGTARPEGFGGRRPDRVPGVAPGTPGSRPDRGNRPPAMGRPPVIAAAGPVANAPPQQAASPPARVERAQPQRVERAQPQRVERAQPSRAPADRGTAERYERPQ